MSENEFRAMRNRSMKSHPITWEDTTEKDGFSYLNDQFSGDDWQFEITRNEHGRVHGTLIDHVFYVVWLDPDHQLYQ
mgnify:CR=1 FL=1